MGAPALTQFAQGQGSVTADMLNGMLQTCDDFAQLRDLVGITGMQVFARGQVTPADGYQGSFFWVASSTATDDNIDIIRPTGGPFMGRWVRIPDAGFLQNFGTATLTSGAETVSFPFPTPNTAYAVTLAGNVTGETFAWSSKSITGFTITSSNAASTAQVDWTISL